MPLDYRQLLEIATNTKPWKRPTGDSALPSGYVDTTANHKPDPTPTPAASINNKSVANTNEINETAAPADAPPPAEEIDEADPGATAPATDGLHERRLLDALYLDVFGEYENGHAVIFATHETRRKLDVIDKPDRITYARLLQLAGPPVKNIVARGNDPDENLNRVPLSQVQNAICYFAGYRRLTDQSLNGPGVWPIKDVDGHRQPGVVLVGAREAAEWNPMTETLTRVTHARSGGRLLDFSLAFPWYQFETMEHYLHQAADKDWVNDVIQEAADQFSRWRWKDAQAPFIMVGLVLAVWVQTVWVWRPQVAITGATKTGKSILLETLSAMFGHLGVRSSKSSAAGIRQAVQSSAKAVFVDEFEDSKHREEVLDMVRASSRGDAVLRGTSNQRGVTFILNHIFFLAAIEIGLQRAPDRNRYITMELIEPLPHNRGKLTLASTEELRLLGQKMLAIAVRYVDEARKLAVRLKRQRHKGVDTRVVESYAVPAAILAAAGSYDDEHANQILGRMLGVMGEEDQTVSDEEDLINAVLSATVRLSGGHEKMVSELLRPRSVDNLEILSRYGIGVINGSNLPRSKYEPKEYLFYDNTAVRKRLLSGTLWERQSLVDILGRIPGAVKDRPRIWGRRPSGVSLPMDYLEKNFLGDGTEILGEKKTNWEEW